MSQPDPKTDTLPERGIAPEAPRATPAPTATPAVQASPAAPTVPAQDDPHALERLSLLDGSARLRAAEARVREALSSPRTEVRDAPAGLPHIRPDRPRSPRRRGPLLLALLLAVAVAAVLALAATGRL